MSWQDDLRDAVPLAERAPFLGELQALVSDLRVGRAATPTPLLLKYPELAIAYLDDGPKKEQARRALIRRG